MKTVGSLIDPLSSHHRYFHCFITLLLDIRRSPDYRPCRLLSYRCYYGLQTPTVTDVDPISFSLFDYLIKKTLRRYKK